MTARGQLPAAGLAEEMIPLLRARLGLAHDAPAQAPAPPPASSPIFDFADRTQERAIEREPAPAPPMRLVLFTLDGETYAVPIEVVQEILRVARITRVPDAPPNVRGLMNVRGRLLPIVEIRTIFGLSPCALEKDARVMMVQVRGRVLGLLVDQVSYVLTIPRTALEAPPREVFGERVESIRGVATQGEDVVIVLDLERTLSLPR